MFFLNFRYHHLNVSSLETLLIILLFNPRLIYAADLITLSVTAEHVV